MKKNVNWFKEQEKKQMEQSKKSSDQPKAKTSSEYKEVKAPIMQVKINPKVEDQHFRDALAFAMKMSDSNSSEIMTVHMDMSLKLHFNMAKDENFQTLWREKKLMCLIAFPRNWKTMVIEPLDDEDAEDYDFSDPIERFEYLYEIGMSISE